MKVAEEEEEECKRQEIAAAKQVRQPPPPGQLSGEEKRLLRLTSDLPAHTAFLPLHMQAKEQLLSETRDSISRHRKQQSRHALSK